jgi:hypothetical protein
MFQQRNSVMKRAFFILNSIYVIVLGLFIVEVLRFYKLQIMEFAGLVSFLVITGIIVLILLGRLILLRLIGYIFDSGNIFAEYIHNVFLANKNLGLFLIPAVVGITYLPYQLAKISVIIGITLIIISIGAGISNYIQKRCFYILFDFVPLYPRNFTVIIRI